MVRERIPLRTTSQLTYSTLTRTANSAHLLVATANEQKGTVDLLHFENEDCQYLESIPAHGFQTSCLQIDRNYQTMVTGSLDHTLGLWDLEDLVCHHTCQLEYVSLLPCCLSLHILKFCFAVCCASSSYLLVVTLHLMKVSVRFSSLLQP